MAPVTIKVLLMLESGLPPEAMLLPASHPAAQVMLIQMICAVTWVMVTSGPGCCGELCLSLWSYNSQGRCWYPWPIEGHKDALDLGCCGPCWGPKDKPLPRAILIWGLWCWPVWTTTKGHIWVYGTIVVGICTDISGSYYHQRLCRCLGYGLPPGTMLKSGGHAAAGLMPIWEDYAVTEDHADISVQFDANGNGLGWWCCHSCVLCWCSLPCYHRGPYRPCIKVQEPCWAALHLTGLGRDTLKHIRVLIPSLASPEITDPNDPGTGDLAPPIIGQQDPTLGKAGSTPITCGPQSIWGPCCHQEHQNVSGLCCHRGP